ncbi:MAG: signal recognition particle protein, partial [Planctomycetes bacterium]|nr:signal recognition particle protein [Planctomycetota bacterium]
GPTILMMAGLQGAGKTTTTAKLGRYLQKRGRKPMLIAADMIRPAAVEQLKTLGEQNKIPVYFEPSGRPVKICERGIAKAVESGCDAVILDTQGRLHVDREMMDELKEIHQKLKPHQTFLVVDAMTGQDAVKSADEFNKQLSLDGVILTKLDGDARGGAALSVKAIVGKPIKWIGMGERIEMLEEFHPDRMADRILGMGDVVTLVEKAREAIDEEQARKLQEKIRKDELTIDDFLKQLESMEKMGPIKSLMKMLPGQLGQMAGDIDENELKYAKAIIRSMTMQERENPELLNVVDALFIEQADGVPAQLLRLQHRAKKLLLPGPDRGHERLPLRLAAEPGDPGEEEEETRHADEDRQPEHDAPAPELDRYDHADRQADGSGDDARHGGQAEQLSDDVIGVRRPVFQVHPVPPCPCIPIIIDLLPGHV